jgi:ABC-type Mn2+/Zn2+ transport system permease subunit
MSTMMVVAAAVAILAGCGGLYLSYYARTAAGASIAAVIVATYAVALAVRATRLAAGGGRAVAAPSRS